MVDAIDEIADAHDVVCATFGHAGDGNLHPTIVFDPDDGDARRRAEAAFDEIFRTRPRRSAARSPASTASARRSVPWLGPRLGADQLALLRRIKTAFDPAGILNPGKLGS